MVPRWGRYCNLLIFGGGPGYLKKVTEKIFIINVKKIWWKCNNPYLCTPKTE